MDPAGAGGFVKIKDIGMEASELSNTLKELNEIHKKSNTFPNVVGVISGKIPWYEKAIIIVNLFDLFACYFGMIWANYLNITHGRSLEVDIFYFACMIVGFLLIGLLFLKLRSIHVSYYNELFDQLTILKKEPSLKDIEFARFSRYIDSHKNKDRITSALPQIKLFLSESAISTRSETSRLVEFFTGAFGGGLILNLLVKIVGDDISTTIMVIGTMYFFVIMVGAFLDYSKLTEQRNGSIARKVGMYISGMRI